MKTSTRALLIAALCGASAAQAITDEPFKVACDTDAKCNQYIRKEPQLRKILGSLFNKEDKSAMLSPEVRALFSDTQSKCLPVALGTPIYIEYVKTPLILKYLRKESPSAAPEYEVFMEIVPAKSAQPITAQIEIMDGAVYRASPTALFNWVKPANTIKQEIKAATTTCTLVPIDTLGVFGQSYPVLAAEQLSGSTHHIIIDTAYGPQSLNGSYYPATQEFYWGQGARANHVFATRGGSQ